MKRPSWIGCHVTALASFLCPLNVCRSSLRLRRSKSLRRWSLEAVISQLPLSFHFKSITVDLWAWRVAKAWPHLGSHSLIGCWLSLLPETMRDFCGCQWTHFTSAPCPRMTRSSWHRRKSKILSVPSSLHVTNFESVGQKLINLWEKKIILCWLHFISLLSLFRYGFGFFISFQDEVWEERRRIDWKLEASILFKLLMNCWFGLRNSTASELKTALSIENIQKFIHLNFQIFYKHINLWLSLNKNFGTSLYSQK